MEPFREFFILLEALNTTIISCGGKWTIPAIARILKAFRLKFRIIHDSDKKGLSEAELEKISPIHPYKANQKIKDAAGDTEIYIIEDTLENILWKDLDLKKGDKPYRAWCRIKEIVEKNEADRYPELKKM